MGQVLIRNIRDDVIEACKARARLNGTSLESYLRELIEEAVPLTADERVALVRSVREQSKPGSRPLTKKQIRDGLE